MLLLCFQDVSARLLSIREAVLGFQWVIGRNLLGPLEGPTIWLGIRGRCGRGQWFEWQGLSLLERERARDPIMATWPLPQYLFGSGRCGHGGFEPCAKTTFFWVNRLKSSFTIKCIYCT